MDDSQEERKFLHDIANSLTIATTIMEYLTQSMDAEAATLTPDQQAMLVQLKKVITALQKMTASLQVRREQVIKKAAA